MKAFRLGPYQIYAEPGRVFAKQDALAVAFQVNNLSEALRASGEVRLEFLKDGQPFRDIRRRAADYADPGLFLEEVALADFPPAHYTVRVSFVNAGTALVTAVEELELSFAESIPRPWSSSRVLPDVSDPLDQVMFGSQLFNLGRFAEARVFLERALAKDPGSEDTAAGLARVYLTLEDAAGAGRVLAAFIDPARSPKYETLILAAEARKRLREFAPAIALLDRAVERYGVNAVLLNSVGECYQGLGKIKEALAAFERSLELSPDQPAVRKRVEELKAKKAG
jgi:tetratricopeptide (TPR) repeat protein